MKPKFNSTCSECGKPCMAPRGNFNAQKVSLCSTGNCKRRRKTALQKNRRKQLSFQGLFVPKLPSGFKPVTIPAK